jgi:signal transduction histidine kinase
MKNQVLTTKLLLDQHMAKLMEYDKELGEKLIETIKEISKTTHTLANFSHIDKLFLEKVDIVPFLKSLLLNYMNHPLFEKVEIISKHVSLKTKIDKNLFRVAFDNLLINALEEIHQQDEIHIYIDLYDTKIKLQIINPYHNGERDFSEFGKIGFSTKPEGSGIGLPISKVIIEKHNGDFNYYIKNDKFIVEIKLFQN